MKERDELLQEIRVDLELSTEKSKSVEVFQSNTLRPILKFQNVLLIEIFKDHIKRTQRTFSALNQKVQMEIIKDSLVKDQRLKNQMIYIIIALFTKEEFDFYSKNLNEINKRVVSMTVQRLQDQLSRLIL
jgi:phosphoribosylanthranilate isomerase